MSEYGEELNKDKRADEATRREFLKLLGSYGLATAILTLLGGDVPHIDNKVKTQPEEDIYERFLKQVYGNERPLPVQEQIDFVRDWGEEPVEMILEKLERDVRLVGIGETHNQLEEQLFFSRVVRKAADRDLVGVLFIELDKAVQHDINSYLQGRKITKDLKTEVERLHGEGYWNILEAARDKNLRVICSRKKEYGPAQDIYMGEQIIQYLDTNPDQKGFFYAGNNHVVKGHNVQLHKDLGDEYYSVLQINNSYEAINDIVYLAAVRSGVSGSIGIDDVSETPFSKTDRNEPFERWSDKYGEITDALVVHVP